MQPLVSSLSPIHPMSTLADSTDHFTLLGQNMLLKGKGLSAFCAAVHVELGPIHTSSVSGCNVPGHNTHTQQKLFDGKPSYQSLHVQVCFFGGQLQIALAAQAADWPAWPGFVVILSSIQPLKKLKDLQEEPQFQNPRVQVSDDGPVPPDDCIPDAVDVA